ncbi:MFS transporter [Paenibacillus lentus]|uniref:MFS transporter n=1 Tax=Paenibacillus lentus TaxID=1338368 RepID=A0A3Q8S3P3_9BACL|nr:MFS transporter [Paenibacillus lentus]AZK45271.1 MFS transporter [Paenibacillus lentus]
MSKKNDNTPLYDEVMRGVFTIHQLSESAKGSLMRNRTFMFFMASMIFTSLTTPMYMLIESWYVVDYLHMPTMLGIVLMVTAIPRVILMTVGGVLSDRFSKTKIMFFSDFIRFLLLVSMAVLFAQGLLTFGVLLVFAAVFGILEAFYWPASSSIIPTLVAPEQLGTANSLNVIIQQLGMFAGPAVAGLILTFGSFQLSFLLLGLLLLLGAICLFLVREPRQRQADRRDSMLLEMGEGFRYISRDPFKVSIIVTVGIASFFISGPVSIAFPTLVKEVFQGTAMDLTYLQVSFAAGSVLGGLMLVVFRPKGNVTLRAYAAFILLCLGIVGLGWIDQLWHAVIISGCAGMISAYANMLLLTVFQLSLEQDKLGRGMSVFTIASTGLYPLSTGLVPLLLGSGWSISEILRTAGMMAGGFLLIVLLSVKALHSPPAEVSIHTED